MTGCEMVRKVIGEAVTTPGVAENFSLRHEKNKNTAQIANGIQVDVPPHDRPQIQDSSTLKILIVPLFKSSNL